MIVKNIGYSFVPFLTLENIQHDIMIYTFTNDVVIQPAIFKQRVVKLHVDNQNQQSPLNLNQFEKVHLKFVFKNIVQFREY